MVNWRRLLRMSNRSFLVFIFFFSMSTTCLYFIYVAPGIANTYFFMVQAQGIMLRENVRTIGQMIRLYTNKNSTVNGTEGLMEVNMTEIPMEDIELKFSKFFDIEFGGHWTPKDCRPPWKVAILIPFRNRHEHLPILFQHLIPMLQRQRLQFAFYVIEQSGSQPFNRAMLFNVGFLEAMKDVDWDCFIFHDVDHIPVNDRNYYGCSQMPRHFAAKLDKYMYILLNAPQEKIRLLICCMQIPKMHTTPLLPPSTGEVRPQTSPAHTIFQACGSAATSYSEDCEEMVSRGHGDNDWNALYEPHGEDIDGITDCVSEYIGFCIDNSIPTKQVCTLSHSPPPTPATVTTSHYPCRYHPPPPC
ncbi:beta-1,4-galactosyltransferase 6 isoform X4 [Paralichthys olivaceus]|uniref:beta-1,4-galactosyltransferase 6 isoform X4 n=2 Tax=Paralichthys olivaceus TaxID=8255 RepID=UPI003752BD61